MLALAAGAGLLSAAQPALAGPGRAVYRIERKPLPDALIDLALQANVSILGVDACGGGGARSLHGRYTLDEALRRLLADAPCAHRIVDARTVALVRAPRRASPAPATREVSAQLAPPAEVAELIVHTTKRDIALGDLAAAASVIPRPGIGATGPINTAETLGQLAGVYMTNLGPGRDKLLIRGVSDGAFTGRARSTVATFLDDVPINYSAPSPDLRFVDVEQIEVLRGPQGSLYGAGALSGVYRIVTNKPELDHASGFLAATGSATKGGTPSGALDGWVNLPLVPDRLAIRAVAYTERLGGYLDDVNMRVSNVDRTLSSGGRVAVRAKLSDTFSLDLSATGQRLDTNDSQYTTATRGPARRANRVRESHDNDFFQTALTLEGDLGDVRMRSSTGYVRHSYASQYDASAVITPADDFELGVYVETARVDLAVQDISFTGAASPRLSWLLGVYGAHSDERTPAELRLRRGAFVDPAYVETRRDRMQEAAVYGEATYRLTDALSISLGARAFTTHVDTEALIEAPRLGLNRSVDVSADTSGVSPKASVQYAFASGDIVYALISDGYRAAGVNSSGLRAPGSLATFEPDHLRNLEIGAKLRLADGRLRLSGAAFYDRWTDIQTDGFLGGSGLTFTANAGDARIAGVEVEAAYDWDFGLSVRANAAFSSSELTRANPGFEAALGRSLPGAPDVSGGLLATYRRPLSGGLELQVVGEASYVGASRVSFDPRLSPPMGDYIRDRIGADVIGGGRRVGLFVTNIANASGDTFAYGNPFSFGQVRQATPQRPRTVGMRISADF